MSKKTAQRLGAAGLAVMAGLAATTAQAGAQAGAQAAAKVEKLSFGVEAEQIPKYARITVTGKKFTPNGVVFLVATPAPGTVNEIDFGRLLADEKGVLKVKKDLDCSTAQSDEATRPVMFMVTDSVSGRTAKQRVEGAAWLCR